QPGGLRHRKQGGGSAAQAVATCRGVTIGREQAYRCNDDACHAPTQERNEHNSHRDWLHSATLTGLASSTASPNPLKMSHRHVPYGPRACGQAARAVEGTRGWNLTRLVLPTR